METKNLQSESEAIQNGLPNPSSFIKVRAIMECPDCGYKKSFKNQFHRSNIEMMVVSLKVFDWISCPTCGDMLQMSLEFQI
ncbi:MAG: hypothetical protein BAJALOKI1v1_1250001 [Promethearchaeota archaeon]|nr:MAG: hypothetical protein BAJALOKI1v1_1250001 [Candidatus Lokiarchaeota archaeon]